MQIFYKIPPEQSAVFSRQSYSTTTIKNPTITLHFVVHMINVSLQVILEHVDHGVDGRDNFGDGKRIK